MALRISQLQVYVLLLVAILLFGSLAIMIVEGLGAFDALYFVVVTIATVGYGDITPVGTPGRAIAMILILAGVGTFVAAFASIIEEFFAREERRKRKKKINMIIGVFFSEFGTQMLSRLSRTDPCIERIREQLIVSDSWRREEFSRLKTELSGNACVVGGSTTDFPGMKAFLLEKRGLLLSLLEHPAIFEHESFTELLLAFFHLTEELGHRTDLSGLSPADAAHLGNDVNRGYRMLLLAWVDYMEHLKENYPYLFSLAVRTNPFNPNAQVEIRDDHS
jgi:hypothetical protein